MNAEYIYKQLENVFTYSGKDKVIADHIAELYKQLEELKNQKEEQNERLEPIDLDFSVKYFTYEPEGWILKREGKGLSYRWYSYRDDLLGERCPNWWWEEITDYAKFEVLYQQAQ